MKSVSDSVLAADKKSVIETEKQQFSAQISKDFTVLEQILSNDLVYNHSSGKTDTKQSFIQSLRDGKRTYNAITVEKQEVHVYTNIGVINGVCSLKAISSGQTVVNHLRYLSVYIRKNNQWQIVAWNSIKLDQ
ncbi:nuclear transport factor 2 family protein [Spirosoma flavum]|uniref:Nuclear transport factor 2 family protein n=1 Tax=Spirosoma flavum TaxID=2048557 RepID=A0ABW6AHV7_9BACT